MELDQFLKERNEALASLDMEWARKMMPHASSDYVRLLALHMATEGPFDTRPEAEAWLERLERAAEDPADPLHAQAIAGLTSN